MNASQLFVAVPVGLLAVGLLVYVVLAASTIKLTAGPIKVTFRMRRR